MDCSDHDRITVANEVLQELARHPGLRRRSIPVIILGNKKDENDAISEIELRKVMKLDTLKSLNPDLIWFIKMTAGKSGQGVADAFITFEEES